MPDDNSSDSQSNATPGRIPNQADWLGLQPPVRISPEEQAVIDTDPATFVALQITEGYNAQQIINKLELAGVSRERADELVSALRSPEVKRYRNQADWLGLQPPVRLSPEEQAVIDTDPATFVALQIMESYNAQQIINKLELAGVSRERADELVSALRSPEVKRYRKSAANKTLLAGGAALVAGIACNLLVTALIGIPLVLAGGVCLVVGLRQRLSA